MGLSITLYRYMITNANWLSNANFISMREEVKKAIISSLFQGDDLNAQYGFAHCQIIDNKVCGLFIQKFEEILTDYGPNKDEIKKVEVNSGKYVFVISLETFEIFLQAKKSPNLPTKDEILNRFISTLRLVFNDTNYMFSSLRLVEERIDRDKIVDIFYKQADAVVEMQFRDFDLNLIAEEKVKRKGKTQKYFNPIEEYNEAMDDASIKFARNAEFTKVKAKQGGDLRKDPMTRGMLEGSRNPVKITYIKEGEPIHDSAMTKNKETLIVEGEAEDVVRCLPTIVRDLFDLNRGPLIPLDEGTEDRLF